MNEIGLLSTTERAWTFNNGKDFLQQRKKLSLHWKRVSFNENDQDTHTGRHSTNRELKAEVIKRDPACP